MRLDIKDRELKDFQTVSAEQMTEAEMLMMQSYRINIIMMLENTGLQLASLANYLLKDKIEEKIVVGIIGPGNNGAGVLAALRHLAIYGYSCKAIIGSAPEEMRDSSKLQLASILNLDVEIINAGGFNYQPLIENADLVIDGIFGYKLNREPEGIYKKMIQNINLLKESKDNLEIIANDIASGLDPDSGESYETCVKPTITLTKGLPKDAFRCASKEFVGELFLSNIGIPPIVFEEINIEIDRKLFHKTHGIIRLV